MNFTTEMSEMLDFDKESVIIIESAAKILIETDREFFKKALPEYMSETANADGIYDELEALAARAGVNTYTASIVFLLLALYPLLEEYKKAGYKQELFIDTMHDIKYKLDECLKVYGVPGTFVLSWFRWFYLLKRFKLGRFQYEIRQFGEDKFEKGLNCILKGEEIINIHIPSNGISLTDEVRLDSYKKAYEFYKPRFKRNVLPFMCHTWLFYEGNEEILPESSNILRFKHDFSIVNSKAVPDSGDLWRIFETTNIKPYENLPENTSLQKRIKKHLLAGGSIGVGVGVMFFDGEKIL